MKDEVLMAALAGLLHDAGHSQAGVSDFLPQRWQEALGEIPQAIAPLASQLSAGGKDSEGQVEERRPGQLQSIFCTVTAEGQTAPDKRFLPLGTLKLERGTIFPDKPLPDDVVQNQYKTLWDDFAEEAKALKAAYETSGGMETYIESLLALLQRFGWCIPAARFGPIADVSLYDHARMTAALAAILSEVDGDRLQAIAENPGSSQDEIALLVGGDISGVQDFIYTITSKGATSSLRGRSFYLQLLTEAAARFTLRELDLPATNLIYGGGGNFYILARASDAGKLDGLRRKLSRILYRHHQGDLYLAVAGVPLEAREFISPQSGNHPLSEKWGELARLLAVVKNRRFSELENDELKTLFEPQGHGGNQDTQCQVCGREHPATELVRKGGDDEGVRYCPACKSYRKLGEELRDARYIGWNFLPHPQTVTKLTGKEEPGSCQDLLREMGFSMKVADAMKEVEGFSHLWALDDDTFGEAVKNAGGRVLIRRLLVNVTPRLSEPFTADDGQPFDKDDIKPFEKLAKDSQGIQRLGVFRADVDNLGRLFAEGLGSHAALSRIASLSFAVSLFFEGWIGVAAKKRNEERKLEHPELGDALYAIYSGGDDLFFVGSWDELVEFAGQVNEDLKAYAAEHPGIHISGGLALVTEKYPLAKAARDAEQAERAAKSLEWRDAKGNPHKKNVLAFLGQPLPWDEFGDARQLKQRLLDLDQAKRSAVIHKLLMNYALYAEAQEKRRKAGQDRSKQGRPQILYGPWNWRIAYLLKRDLEDKNKEHERLMDDFHVVPDAPKGPPDYARLEWVGVAARWAELRDRK